VIPVVYASLSHCASVLCPVPAEVAYAFLLDGRQLGTWALGSFDTQPIGDGIFRGRSLFDDTFTLVRPVGDPTSLRVDYYVGSRPDQLVSRIAAVVVRGVDIGQPVEVCQVNLLAWRHAGMDDERWLRLVRAHEVEVLLIQARLKLQQGT